MLLSKITSILVTPRNPKPAIIAIFSPVFLRWNCTLKVHSLPHMTELAWRTSIISTKKQEGILHLFISSVPSQEQIRTHYGKAIQTHTFKENTFVSSINRKANAVRKLLSVTQHPVWKNKHTFFFVFKAIHLNFHWNGVIDSPSLHFIFKRPKNKNNSVHWICFKELEHTGLCLITFE